MLAALGSEHALVVHGADGLDEITTTAPTRVAEVRDGEVRTFELARRSELGVAPATARRARGGSPEENAARLAACWRGERGPLARRSSPLNAGAALYVAGLAPTSAPGSSGARGVLASGAAQAKLEELRAFR